MIGRPKPVRFTIDDAQKAGDAWRFNCGPAALCAVLKKTPDEIRPHLITFEKKGYINPTLMLQILKHLQVKYSLQVNHDPFDYMNPKLPSFGLVRIQWGGPWTKNSVPMPARYRKTHWIATFKNLAGEYRIFDINAICCGGWIDYLEWGLKLVPWLLKQCEPKADGSWWPTHRIEVSPESQMLK